MTLAVTLEGPLTQPDPAAPKGALGPEKRAKGYK